MRLKPNSIGLQMMLTGSSSLVSILVLAVSRTAIVCVFTVQQLYLGCVISSRDLSLRDTATDWHMGCGASAGKFFMEQRYSDSTDNRFLPFGIW